MNAPSPWVLRWLAALPPRASMLDVACGSGRHARAAIERGLIVTAIDCDADALARLPDGVERLHFDLEQGTWPFEQRSFDAVVVTRYLHRPLFDRLVEAVAPGGLLIYETFADGQARYGRPTRADYLLQPGELFDRLRRALHVLAFEDGCTAPPVARIQRVAAMRPPTDHDGVHALERHAL